MTQTNDNQKWHSKSVRPDDPRARHVGTRKTRRRYQIAFREVAQRVLGEGPFYLAEREWKRRRKITSHAPTAESWTSIRVRPEVSIAVGLMQERYAKVKTAAQDGDPKGTEIAQAEVINAVFAAGLAYVLKHDPAFGGTPA